MWSTNSKEIFLKNYLEKNFIKQPLEQEFQNVSGGVKKINSKLLIYVQLLFSISMFHTTNFSPNISNFKNGPENTIL